MSTGLSRRLCEAVHALRIDDLPPAAIDAAKRLAFDAIGLIGGGACAPGIATLNARLARWESGGSATGLVGRRRYSPPTAALANGAAAHALDFDDLHDAARVHTCAVILPTVLATAEDRGGVSGRDFVFALAIGAEIHARLGLSCVDALGKGWHPTMVFGTLAGALAAGKLLGLDATGLGHALGMGYHQASGSAQSMRDGVLSKRLGAGFAARAAVLSAFLAKDGLTSTERTLEGNAGLYALYERGEGDPERLLAGWGRTWEVANYSFKPYPGCRANHTAVGLAIALHRRGIRADDIESVEVGLGKVNCMSVGGAYESERGSIVHAQFNAAYNVARALADGRVELGAYTPEAIVEPRVVDLARRVRTIEDPAIDPQAIVPARLTLRLRDGARVESFGETMPGSPQAPMSDADFEAKFRACLEHGMHARPSDVERLLATSSQLERLADVRSLIDAFPVQDRS